MTVNLVKAFHPYSVRLETNGNGMASFLRKALDRGEFMIRVDDKRDPAHWLGVDVSISKSDLDLPQNEFEARYVAPARATLTMAAKERGLKQ